MTAGEFNRLKRFILKAGDRQTYCNMYNANPHFDFGSFDAFLHPDVMQANINFDPALSDFDRLVVRDDAGGPTFYATFQVHGGVVTELNVYQDHAPGRDARVANYWSRMLEAAG